MEPYNPIYGAHPAEVRRRFLRRLRDFLNLDETTCFLVDDPYSIPVASVPDRAYVLHDDGAVFNSNADQDLDNIKETVYIGVTCFNRLSAIDESSRARSFVSQYETNLYEMARRVMRALVGWRLELDDVPDLMIASTVKVARASKPQILQADSGCFGAFLTLSFSVSVGLNLCENTDDV